MKIAAQCTVEVILRRDGLQGGGLPDFVVAAHRHFQKEKPLGLDSSSTSVLGSVFRAPVDLIRLVVPPNIQGEVVDTIEEVLVAYKKR